MSSSSTPSRPKSESAGVISKTKQRYQKFRDSISPHRHEKHEQKRPVVSSDRDRGANALQVPATLGYMNNEESGSKTDDNKSLWALAFEDLEKANPELIEKFKYCMAVVNEADSVQNSEPATKEVVQNAFAKINDLSKEAISGKSDKVRKCFEQTIKLVISTKDFISAAVAANPYAATAWTGVCLVLPLLLNPSQENDASIEGVNCIVNLMIRYVWKEKVYLNEDAASDFARLAKALYIKIVDYQATLLVHMHRNPPRRWVRDVFKAGDWESRIKNIKELDLECKQLTDDIDAVRAQRWREDEQQWQQGLLQQHRDEKEKTNLQMLYSNYEAGKNANPMRVSGTCEWFLGHPDFLSWRQSQCSSLLWLSADPGCGKSVLSKYLTDCKGEVLSLNPGVSMICYFFFKDGDVDRMDGAKAVCALLHQIFLQQPRLYEHAKEDFECKGEKFLTDLDALWKIFMNAASESEREIICVLDALDECQESSRKSIITKLVTFYKNVEQGRCEKPALKFLVTSRPYIGIEWDFKELTDSFPNIRLSGEEESESISREINLVIEFKLQELGKRRTINQEALQRSLLKFPNRTYLWLHLVFDIIEKSLVIKKNEVPKAILEIPETVDKAYTAILHRSPDPEAARKLLHIVLAATRPLNLEEVNVAMNINDDCGSKDDLDLWPAEECNTIVKNICGLFLSVVDSRVYLIHQTAREFLLCKDTTSPVPRQSLSSGVWKESFHVEESHSILAKICISYLLFSDFQKHNWFSDWNYKKTHWRTVLSGKRALTKYLKGRNMMEYAAWEWHAHFTRAGNFLEPLLVNTVALEIFDIRSHVLDNWSTIHCEKDKDLADIFPKISSLILGSYFGLEAVVRLLLENGVSVDSRGVDERTALHIATTEGHKAVVQLLLEKGANIEAEDEYERTALHIAIAEGHKAVVQLLLEKGANIDVKNKYKQTTLHRAAKSGDEAIMQLLLEKGGDIEAKNDDEETALHIAARLGDEMIVQLLLENGADTEAKKNEYEQTALHVAVRNGYESIVQLLLEKGANIEAEDRYKQTALHEAAENGYEAIVQLLLEKGANIEAENKVEQTALHEAVSRGHKASVQLLLEHGADIEAKDVDGRTALHIAARRDYEMIMQLLLEKGANTEAEDCDGETVLRVAVHKGFETIVHLLLKTGVDIETKDIDGQTALHIAARWDYEMIMKSLLKSGADIEAKKNDRQTALHLAARWGYEMTMQSLLKNGANIEAKDRYGNTALHEAVKGAKGSVVQLLLQRGIDIEAKDRNGYTALDLAESKRHEEIVQLLKAASASKSSPLTPHETNSNSSRSVLERQ